MRSLPVIGATIAAALLAAVALHSAFQASVVHPMDEQSLREYEGTYQWSKDAYLYLQMWSEFSGKDQLVAFDESGEVRTLYPTDRDRFFAGPGCAVPGTIEARIQFQRNGTGRITSLTWG